MPAFSIIFSMLRGAFYGLGGDSPSKHMHVSGCCNDCVEDEGVSA